MTPRYLLLILVALGAAWGAPDYSTEPKIPTAGHRGIDPALPGPSHGGSPSHLPVAVSRIPVMPSAATVGSAPEGALSVKVRRLATGAVSEPAQPGEVGTALIGGWATWHDNGPGLYAAAGPELRAAFGSDWRGTVVEVAGPGGAVVRVTLSDACACGERHGMPTFLDLSADAFSELAPLSWGIVAVSVELVPVLPATDWREP